MKKQTLLIVAFMSTAPMAMAAITAISSVTGTTTGTGPAFTSYLLTSITVGSDVYGISTLATGTTTGNPTISLPNIDDLDLITFNANAGNNPSAGASLPVRTVLFGGSNWTNTNGALQDFFLFESSGSLNGDSITIAAIFTDDSLGTNVTVTNPWGDTGVDNAGQGNQNIIGTSWSITDLKDAGGINLTNSSVIKGIAITAGGGIDPNMFIAAVPEPSAAMLGGLGVLALLRRRRA